MKERLGFVSNSSSSSFIVRQDFTEEGIACLLLNPEQRKKVVDFVLASGRKDVPDWIKDPKENLYVTEFISDCDSRYDAIEEGDCAFLEEGELCGEPRCEEYYNRYDIGWESVYIRKELDSNISTTIDKFSREWKKDFGKDIIVEWRDDYAIIRRA